MELLNGDGGKPAPRLPAISLSTGSDNDHSDKVIAINVRVKTIMIESEETRLSPGSGQRQPQQW